MALITHHECHIQRPLRGSAGTQRDLTALTEVGRAVSSTLDLKVVLKIPARAATM